MINKILFTLVIILVISLAGVLFWQKGGFEKSYYAVYLDTGDLYFGKISWFPKFSLSNVYLLQKTNDQQNPFSISKFENAFWSPENKLYLNYDNVIWKAKLKDNSQVINYINSLNQKTANGEEIKQSPVLNSTSSNIQTK